MWETQLRVNNLHKGVAQRRKSNREAISASRKGKDKIGMRKERHLSKS